jgi:hypothetical protein
MGITREEKLLNSIANGVYSGVQPVTREEQYLSYIAGESYEKPENPITRKELYLDKIPQGGSGGGGVTIRNQNKTITENGTYTADSGYTGLGTVTVSVPEKVPNLQEKTATENGEVVADEGYDGLSKVTVNVGGSTGGVNKLAQFVEGNITEITAEDLQGITKIGDYAFQGKDTLLSIVIPKTVDTVGTFAFAQARNLSSVVFEEGSQLKTIGDNGFYYITAGIKNIILPQTLESIGSNAFTYCMKLKSVVLKSTTPPTIQSNTFNSVPSDCVFTVPYGSGNAYRTATNWSARADYIVEGDV